jgi:uncharacterized protein YjbI with pentapeptide repeats
MRSGASVGFEASSSRRCNLRNAELSFSDATGANFRNANLDGCMLYRSEIALACFDDAELKP